MYNPKTDSWSPISSVDAPFTPRTAHTATWTGQEMIVWGGNYVDPYRPNSGFIFNDGGRYNPETDTWTPISGTGAAPGRYSHTAIWTGTEMILWGGHALHDTTDYYLSDTWAYTPQPPILSIAQTGMGNRVVSWQYPSSGFVLEQSSDLNATDWIAVPLVTHDSNMWSVTNSVVVRHGFYRLSKEPR